MLHSGDETSQETSSNQDSCEYHLETASPPARCFSSTSVRAPAAAAPEPALLKERLLFSLDRVSSSFLMFICSCSRLFRVGTDGHNHFGGALLWGAIAIDRHVCQSSNLSDNKYSAQHTACGSTAYLEIDFGLLSTLLRALSSLSSPTVAP